MPVRPSSGRRQAVTARAAEAVSQKRGWHTSPARLSLALLALFASDPASAEIGLAASVFSDARFRGYSLSEGRPIATFDLAYDDPSGFYAGAAASGVLDHDGSPRPFSLQVDGGYASRLESGTTIDFGLTHSNYANYSSAGRGNSYTEIYAGLARGAFSSRIYISPHYFETGDWTAYGEVNANLSPARDWSIDGHAGVLFSLSTPYDSHSRPDFDWSIGLSRKFGRVALQARWSDGTPGHDYYRGRRHSRSALVFGATFIL